MHPRRVKTYLLLIGVALIWGVAASVLKYTLNWFSPDIFLAYRFTISAAIAVVFFIFAGGLKLPKNPRILLWAIVYAFLNSTVQLGILFLGYDKTSAVNAIVISSTGPLFVSLAGVYFLNEHMTKREKVGLAIAFIGTVVTIIEPALRNHNGSSGILGNVLVFLAVLIGIMNAVLAKILLREKLSPNSAVNLTFMVGFLTMIPVVLLLNPFEEVVRQVVQAPIGFHLAVLYMAVLSGNLAYYWWHKAQKSIEIGEVGMFSYLQPIFAAPLAVLWLKESITYPFILGALIIASGVAIAEYKGALKL